MTTAIVTGGNRGLGAALITCFAERGYRTMNVYRADHAAALDQQRALRARGWHNEVMCHDVVENGLQEQLSDFVRDAEQELVLINNAAANFALAPFHLQGWESFAEQLAVTLKGSWGSCLALLPSMVAHKRGTIVNVLSSSVLGEAAKGMAPYVTAKYALLGLGKALAAEYRPRGVRIFAVAPGFMDTALSRHWGEHFFAAMEASTPMSLPVRVAQAIVDLVEDPNLPATGECYDLRPT